MNTDNEKITQEEEITHGVIKGKVIAVWGDNGNTTLSTALASELAIKRQKQVMLISSDKIVPANALWHIENPVSFEKSIGALLKNEDINSSTIAKYLTVNEKVQKNIATLSFCDGDNVLNSTENLPYSAYVKLVQSAQSVVDYVIIDCIKDVRNLLTLAACELADLQIISLTPDVRGVQFYKSNMPLLTNEKFGKCKRIFVSNLTTSHNDVFAFGDVIGNKIEIKLPLDEGVRKAVALGDFLRVSKYVGFKYKNELHKIMKIIDTSYDYEEIKEKKKKTTKEKQ